MSAPARRVLLLERALMATWVVHGLAMLSMALFLLPMMPGGPMVVAADRVARIATHPWLFRFGWLAWQVTAASDLWLAYAFVRTSWIPRAPAYTVLLLTLAAIVPDQAGQILWETRGVALAQVAQSSGDLAPYLAYEAHVFALTGVWAALLYTFAAIGWTWSLMAAGAWTRLLSVCSVATWGTFLVVTVGPLLPPPMTLPERAVAAGNAVGFLLLMLWLAVAAEQVMRRTRAAEAHGRWAPWRAPRAGVVGWLESIAANSRFVRQVCAALPVLRFKSDITDVVYANYLVPAAQLEAFVPEGLKLQRLGPDGAWAMFTFLSYRHGHFGPEILGPLRRWLMRSPVHSNWRTYVRDPHTGKEGIYFVTNAVTTWEHALGARLMSEGMPMHLLAHAELTCSADGTVRLLLDPGQGSAPDAHATLTPAKATLPVGEWTECFASYDAMLRYAVPQDRAMSTRALERDTVREEIDLGIPIASCEPLQGEVASRAARAIVGDARAVVFRVPRVPFRFTGEIHDRWPEAP